VKQNCVLIIKNLIRGLANPSRPSIVVLFTSKDFETRLKLCEATTWKQTLAATDLSLRVPRSAHIVILDLVAQTLDIERQNIATLQQNEP